MLTGWKRKEEQLGAGLWPLAGLAWRVGVSKRRTFCILLIFLPDGMEWKEYLVGRTHILYAIDPSECDMGQEPLKIAPNVLPLYSKCTPETPEPPL